MFKFYMNMWVMKRVTAAQLNTAALKGFLTQEEVATIVATAQI